jgi:hypothetical protein
VTERESRNAPEPSVLAVFDRVDEKLAHNVGGSFRVTLPRDDFTKLLLGPGGHVIYDNKEGRESEWAGMTDSVRGERT